MDYYGNDNNGSGGFQNDPFSPGNDPSFSGGWDNGPSMNGEDPDHHNKNKRSRKPMSPKQKGAIKIVALCLVCALLGGLAQPIYSSLSGGNETTIYTGDRTPTQVDTASVDTSKELTTAEIYAKYVNSCVGITVDIVSTNVFGQTVTGAAAGSGFVITEDGYILTNYHVIDGANSIKVTFDNGKEYTATYVGGEEKNDIAVIKVDATGLTPVVIGKSSDMLVGEQVTTIGNPLGERRPPDEHDPDRLRYQLRQLRRPAVQQPRRGHRHRLRQVFLRQQFFLRLRGGPGLRHPHGRRGQHGL